MIRKENWKCINCGRCCVVYTQGAGAVLTKREIKAKKYDMMDRPGNFPKIPNPIWGDMIVKTETVRLTEYGIDAEVCTYLDPNTMKCTIYDKRPNICQTFNCKGDQCTEYWNELIGSSENEDED